MLELPKKDIDVLRRLAERKVAAEASPVNAERREAWYAHDSGSTGRPMVLAEYGGIRDVNLPVPNEDFECSDEWARGVERGLRGELYQFDELQDDHVIEPFMNVNWHVTISDYGVQPVVHSGDHDGKMGSRRWDPPIADLDTDFDKLTPQKYSVDRDATFEKVELMESVFDGILPTRIRGSFYWTTGLTIQAIDLIGLDGLMLAMYDNPPGLHRLMAFLKDQHLAMASWLEEEGLYSPNNENDYIGSGSMGYTRALPSQHHDLAPSPDAIRTQDLWVLSESQETVGVGPELFEEFIFPYQEEIVSRFGRCYYGCCEPVHNRWHIIERLPRLARVSVSPWADEEFMAEHLGADYVYSRKPAPSMISMNEFNEDEIRADIHHTLDVAKNCRIELIMKDVHTLHEEPERLARWVYLARDEIDRMVG